MNITMESKKEDAGPPQLDQTMLENEDEVGGIDAIREVSENSGS